MRFGTLALLAVGCFNLLASDQPRQQDANTQCIESLRVPGYPAIAVSARLYGDVNATLHLGPGGIVKDVALAGKPHPLLANAVFDAIRASTFKLACEGRNVDLSFQFRIEGLGTDYPTAPVVSFAFPNTFRIVSPPRNAQP